MKKITLTILAILPLLSACGNDSKVKSSGFILPSESSLITNYGIDSAFNTDFPSNYQIAKDAGFDYFIKIPLRSDPSISISILATDESPEDLRQAIGVWTSLLSENGANTELSKLDVFKSMSQRQGTLFMAASESDIGKIKKEIVRLLKLREPKITDDNYLQLIALDNDLFKKYGWFINSQPLGYNETIYIGEPEYFTGYDSINSMGTRDASIEEILHLTQAQGIAPLTGDGSKGGLQKRITDHSLSIFKDYRYDNTKGLYVYEDKDTSKDYIAESSIWSPQGTGMTLDEKRKERWDSDWGG